MKKPVVVLSLVLLCLSLSQCHKAGEFPEADYDARLSGGSATVFDESSRAFTHGISALSGWDLHIHELGDKHFEQTFVSAPSPVNSGLGPIFNNVSCISCHHNDGKGTPTAGFPNSSMLFRISLPGADAVGGPVAISGYGGQLQDRAIFGRQPEAKVSIEYTQDVITYPDGQTVSLRRPSYTISGWYDGTAPAGCLVSPRLAPPVFGLGLLELISEQTLQMLADEQAADGNGIRGQLNYVYNPMTGKTEVGRFGLKASVPTIALQVAGAYHQDMGVTSSVFPVESCYGQPQADTYADDPELPDSILAAVTFYIKTLAVPARRDVAVPEVLNGEKLFVQLSCASCHRPTLQTGIDVRFPYLSNQRIHPYTDLLLHDMGEGLADQRPDFKAGGRQWRTPALWGVGLFEKTNGVPYYLHDGRAWTLEEAILWHGGEAANARRKFMELSRSERDHVIRFLKSL